MKKLSVSFVKGKGSLRHNNREFIAENVDQNRTKDNITYIKQPLEDAYKLCFEDAVETYNVGQKRADRRIDGAVGYMEQIRQSKNGEKLFYENLVQIGNMHDCHVGTKNGEIAKQILDEYARSFLERNPNLYVFNMVLHLDEQTPHLHIDYIPLAHNYKVGLATRNSLDRALGEQGLTGKSNKFENKTKAWQNREKIEIERIMREHEIEKREERGIGRKHMTIEQYKVVVEEVQNEVRSIPKQIETAPYAFNKERVSVAKTDLEKLEKRARLSSVHEKATAEIKEIAREELSREIFSAKQLRLAAEENYQKSEEVLAHAKQEKADADRLYRAQVDLVNECNRLKERLAEKDKKIDSLAHENELYQLQIGALRQTIEQKVEQAIAPYREANKSLKLRLSALEERFDTACEKLASLAKTIAMVKYDTEKGYRCPLPNKASALIDAIGLTTAKWLNRLGKKELSETVGREIGISKDIEKTVREMIAPPRSDKEKRHDFGMDR